VERNPNMIKEENKHQYKVVISQSSITNLTVRVHKKLKPLDRDILQELFEKKSTTDETLNE
jgi:hypothetical protein